ncbi:hypothetical protein YYG_04547 [Plasmodium vinckei petteri]|uniref:Uncharacterized protein n=1 Tax=Plasmodium vinckei petteri TaxID=138298 RepID=W7AXQ7_PLAVN|nr:hypothetical protein YYG_04547 [Plasmodium vinckei petteri]CAD2096157.1 conserved Plasmodium protein, unknown function [Plasmodium vinckei petteri]
MAIKLCRILRRSNRKWGIGWKGNRNLNLNKNDNEFRETNETFDEPLKENEGYPSYIQPSGNKTNWSENWRNENEKKKKYNFSISENYAYNVPYNYKIVIPPSKKKTKETDEREIKEEYSRDVSNDLTYTDYCGFRNPTLETFDNYRYWQDSGFKKFMNRIFPIKIPEHKKINPLLREYIYFLHSLDPFRFTFKKLSERYFFSENCIKAIYKEESVKKFLEENQLCDDKTKRISKKEAVLKIKELIYSKKIGYKDIGDYENIKNDDDEFQGYKNTFDQINRQVIQVESISAFPLPDRRNPVPKRVDVDIPVFNSANVKIMNWINPNDKVIF